MICLMYQQHRIQILVHISPLSRIAAISMSPSAASMALHARVCLRCIAMARGQPKLLLLSHRYTDEISAPHKRLQVFPFLFVHASVGLA